MAIDKDLMGAIAVTRFGLGAKGGEIAFARGDPRGYLLDQITPKGADQPQVHPENSAARLAEVRDYRDAVKAAKVDGQPRTDPVKMAARLLRGSAGADFMARARLGATTEAGFRERWSLFWANHFTVAATKLATAPLVGPFEQEAIRPRVFGRFEDLLAASSSHPAMLLYLDQSRSIGPHSPAALHAADRDRKAGLNENLAREILELHTVGVEAGYSQTDVTEFARALTGWSIGRFENPKEPGGRFMFRPFAHEPGARTILGRRYGEDGQSQASDVLRDLAASPHTAHHLAVKIARHFVADDPPAVLTTRLERTYLETGGDLAAVARTLVKSPEAWAPEAVKFKTPYEFMVSAWRASDTVPDDIGKVAPELDAMGQKAFSAPSPKGWPDEAQAWCAPDAVIKRMAWSEALAAQAAGQRDPGEVALNTLGARLTPPVAKAISRAESRPEGLAILLMSPEFQRR